MLFTEQCLHFRLQRSETMTVPRMGSFFLKRTVFSQNLAKYKNDDVFMIHKFFLLYVLLYKISQNKNMFCKVFFLRVK
jgi:hypothetical protein